MVKILSILSSQKSNLQNEPIAYDDEISQQRRNYIRSHYESWNNGLYQDIYEKEYKNKDYANELPFQYSAYLTHLYIATYNGKYNGFINECDLDNDMYKYGKFYGYCRKKRT